jgi:hypothetical protein
VATVTTLPVKEDWRVGQLQLAGFDGVDEEKQSHSQQKRPLGLGGAAFHGQFSESS